ncbi:hypothetical protein DXT91_11110 [Agrobacterium tumefaciens]|nr:hypothetical protein [Agrobacterium tumefaciens]
MREYEAIFIGAGQAGPFLAARIAATYFHANAGHSDKCGRDKRGSRDMSDGAIVAQRRVGATRGESQGRGC